jgi:hypothetical protein
MPKIKFHLHYFILAVLLFLIEVSIAVYLHDDFVRPFIGDVLVVIFLYCLVKSFWDAKVLPTAIAVLLFAYFIEMMQYFHFVALIGLEKSKLANTILGNYYTWKDLIAYTAGFVIILLVEKFSLKSKLVL